MKMTDETLDWLHGRCLFFHSNCMSFIMSTCNPRERMQSSPHLRFDLAIVCVITSFVQVIKNAPTAAAVAKR